MSQSQSLKRLFSKKFLLSWKRKLHRWALGKLEEGNEGNTSSGQQSTKKLTAGDGQAWAGGLHHPLSPHLQL